MSISDELVRSPYVVNESADMTLKCVKPSSETQAIFKGLSVTFTDRGTRRTEKIPFDAFFTLYIAPGDDSVEVGKVTKREVAIRKQHKDNIEQKLEKVIIVQQCIIDDAPQDQCVIDLLQR